MTESNSILIKLDGLESRYEEVSTLITDPSVIADQERYVKLTREYKELGDIMEAKKKYICCLNSIREAKDILTNGADIDILLCEMFFDYTKKCKVPPWFLVPRR